MDAHGINHTPVAIPLPPPTQLVFCGHVALRDITSSLSLIIKACLLDPRSHEDEKEKASNLDFRSQEPYSSPLYVKAQIMQGLISC